MALLRVLEWRAVNRLDCCNKTWDIVLKGLPTWQMETHPRSTMLEPSRSLVSPTGTYAVSTRHLGSIQSLGTPTSCSEPDVSALRLVPSFQRCASRTEGKICSYVCDDSASGDVEDEDFMYFLFGLGIPTIPKIGFWTRLIREEL